MNLFSKMFGGGDKALDNTPQIPWTQLTSVTQLEQLTAESKTKTVLIFKHSTRCGISSMSLRRFESDYNRAHTNVSLYFLDLIRFREVSNQVALNFGVIHQSPQLIVIKNGQAVHYASHSEIQAQTIDRFA